MALFKNNFYFYHSHVKRIIATFGYVFSDLAIATFNSEGKISKIVSPLPVQFANGDTDLFLNREGVNSKNDSNLSSGFKEVFPRLTYTLDNIQYNPDRKHSRNNVVRWTDENGTVRSVNKSVPYTASFSLNIISNKQSDVLQVFEQIASAFQPDLVVKIKDYPVIGNIYDLPISLISTNIEDNFDDSIEGKRRVIYTLEFEVMFQMYGPTGSIIEYDALLQNLSLVSGKIVKNDNDFNSLRGKSSEIDNIISQIDCINNNEDNQDCGIVLKFSSVDGILVQGKDGTFCEEKELVDYLPEEIDALETKNVLVKSKTI